MKTVKAKIKGTNAILEGCVCDDSFFVSVDHDTFERYGLDEVEICKDSLHIPETCKENAKSFTSLEETAEEYAENEAYSWELTDAPPKNNLEEAAEEYATTHIRNNEFPTADSAFIAGAEWQKAKDDEGTADLLTIVALDAGQRAREELMMKEAVEAKIYGYDDGSFELIASWLDMPNNSIYKDGDKVKIIIVKQ